MTAPEAPAPPEQTLAQRMDALARANEIRTKRSALKADLAEKRASIVTVLCYPPQYAETAKVLTMMLAVPAIGPTKATKLMRLARVSPSKTIAGLSERQRAELVSLLLLYVPAHLRER